MANIPIRGKITQDAEDASKTSEFNLDLTKGNAFRIDKIVLQADLVKPVDTAYIHFQIAAEESASLLTLDDPNEILTLGHLFNHGSEVGEITHGHVNGPGGESFEGLEAFITDAKFWMHINTEGQTGVKTVYFKIYGQYVHLKQKDLERIRSGATF